MIKINLKKQSIATIEAGMDLLVKNGGLQARNVVTAYDKIFEQYNNSDQKSTSIILELPIEDWNLCLNGIEMLVLQIGSENADELIKIKKHIKSHYPKQNEVSEVKEEKKPKVKVVKLKK